MTMSPNASETPTVPSPWLGLHYTKVPPPLTAGIECATHCTDQVTLGRSAVSCLDDRRLPSPGGSHVELSYPSTPRIHMRETLPGRGMLRTRVGDVAYR